MWWTCSSGRDECVEFENFVSEKCGKSFRQGGLED